MKMYLYILIALLSGIVLGVLLAKFDTKVIDVDFPQSCLYKGEVYKHGQGFKDECNSCSCRNGEVACTLIACESDQP